MFENTTRGNTQKHETSSYLRQLCVGVKWRTDEDTKIIAFKEAKDTQSTRKKDHLLANHKRYLFESKKQERLPPKQAISSQLKCSSDACSKLSEQTDIISPPSALLLKITNFSQSPRGLCNSLSKSSWYIASILSMYWWEHFFPEKR